MRCPDAATVAPEHSGIESTSAIDLRFLLDNRFFCEKPEGWEGTRDWAQNEADRATQELNQIWIADDEHPHEQILVGQACRPMPFGL